MISKYLVYTVHSACVTVFAHVASWYVLRHVGGGVSYLERHSHMLVKGRFQMPTCTLSEKGLPFSNCLLKMFEFQIQKIIKSSFSNWFLLRFLIRAVEMIVVLTNTRAEPLAPSDCETSIVESHGFQGCHGGHCGRSKSEWQCVAVSWWIFSFWKTSWDPKRFAVFFVFRIWEVVQLYNSHELVCDGPFC